MRPITAFGVVGIAVSVAGCDSGSVDCGSAPAIPGTWTSATLHLSCASTDLQTVTAAPPCEVGDEDASSYAAATSFQLASPTPGTCHVTFVFGNGVTYVQDVLFTEQSMNVASCNGSVMSESFVGPPQTEILVANPASSCLDGGSLAAEAGLDAAASPGSDGDASRAGDSGEAGASDAGYAAEDGGDGG